jgi:flagellar biosynthesis protein FlhG
MVEQDSQSFALAAVGEGDRGGGRLVALAGGRGGIGRSVLAVNAAVYLAQLGRHVVLVDADLGGSCLHTLLGLERPARSLAQVIDRRADHVAEMIVDTPVPNLRLLAGGADRFGVANLRPAQKERLLQQLRDIDGDVVLLDAGAGTSFNVLDLYLAADHGVLLTVPEPTAVEAVYRFLRSAVIRLARRELGRQSRWPRVLDETVVSLGGLPGPLELQRALAGPAPLLAELIESARRRLRPWLVVNRCRVRTDAELGLSMRTLAAHHLGISLAFLGSIEADDSVWLAVRKRRPVMIEAPGTPAAKDMERICRRILAASTPRPGAARGAGLKPLEALTHYEVLEVDVGASEEEIRRGQKRLRDLYQPATVAGSGLLDLAMIRDMHERAQAAYDTLLDPRSRRAYDKGLAQPHQHAHAYAHAHAPAGQPAAEPPFAAPERRLPRPPAPLGVLTSPSPAPAPSPGPAPGPAAQAVAPALEITSETEFTGELLRRVREAKGVELNDVTARTKIGTAYLRAIEDEDFAHLPALVYTRGFVGELAKYLELNHHQVVTSYLKRFKKFIEERGAGGGKAEP